MRLSTRESEISAVILAGGENRRFDGRQKAKIKVDGIPIIESIKTILCEIFEETFIVTNNPGQFEEYGLIMVSDIFKKVGPLGGIHVALKNAKTNAVFVVACDMPWLSSDIIIEQINSFRNSDFEVQIPLMNGKMEPLHAIYSKSLFNRLDTFLSKSKRYAIKDFLELAKVSYFNIPDTESERLAFSNVNSPGDIRNGQID